MKPKPKPKKPPGHADPDEYQRFLKVAKEIGASDDPKDFDRAFGKVTRTPSPENANEPLSGASRPGKTPTRR